MGFSDHYIAFTFQVRWILEFILSFFFVRNTQISSVQLGKEVRVRFELAHLCLWEDTWIIVWFRGLASMLV